MLIMEIAIVVGIIAIILIGLSSASCNSGCCSTISSLISAVTGKMNFSEIQVYAANAGFTGNDLNTATAIALAESSGNPIAVGDVTLAPTKGPSIGLWQINIGSKAHGSQYTQAELFDPQTNADAAYAIYEASGNTFSAWSTYTSLAYIKYLPAGSSCCNTEA
jgi:hypothetical protein